MKRATEEYVSPLTTTLPLAIDSNGGQVISEGKIHFVNYFLHNMYKYR